MNIDETKIKVSKLSPKPGDLLIFSFQRGDYPEECYVYLNNLCRDIVNDLKGVQWVLVYEGQKIECLTEEDMLKLGYVKIDKPIVKEGG